MRLLTELDLSLLRFGAHLLYHVNQLYIVYSTILLNLLFLSVVRFVCPSVKSLYGNLEDKCYFAKKKFPLLKCVNDGLFDAI